MTRRRILKLAAALLAVLVLLGAAAIWVVQSSWFYGKVRALIVENVEKATGGRVELAAFRFDWKRLRAEADGFVLHGTEPAGNPPLFSARSVAVGIKVVSVFERSVDIQYLEVAGPHIDVMVGADGRTNVPEPKVKSASNKPVTETILDLAVGRFDITDGVFEIAAEGKTPFAASGQHLNLTLAYDRTGPRYRGNLSVQPLDTRIDDYGPAPLGLAASFVSERNRIGIDSARITHTGLQVDVTGALEDLAAPHAAFRYDARVVLADVMPILRVRELRHGTAQVTGSGTWTPAGGVALEGKLHAAGVEYRDAFVRLAGFRADGAVTVGTKGVDASGLRISGDYVNGERRAPVEGRIASVALRGKDLQLGGIALALLGGSLQAEASLRGLDHYVVKGEISGFEARRTLALFDPAKLPWDSRAYGSIYLDGSIRRPKALHAEANLTLAPAVEGPPVHGQITANYEADGGTLDLGRSALALPHSRAEFSGVLGRRLQVHVETRDLNDLLPVLGESTAKLPVKLRNGSVSFDGTVTGKLDRPEVVGHTSATQVEYSGEAADSLEADLTAGPQNLQVRNASVARGSLKAQFSGSVALADWTVPETSPITAAVTIRQAPLAEAIAAAKVKDPGATGTLAVTAQISGTVADPRASGDIELTKGSYRNEPFDRATAHVDYSASAISVTNAQIVAGAKQVQLTASFHHKPEIFDAGSLRFQMISNVMPLEEIHTVTEARPDLKGTVHVNAAGEVELAKDEYRVQDLHGNIELKEVQLTGQALGEATVTVNSQNQVLKAQLVSDIAHCAVRGTGEWRLEGDYPGSANITFSKLDLNELRRWVSAPEPGTPDRFVGSAEGEVHIDGPALKPKAMKAELHIPKVEIAPAPASGLATAPLTLRNAAPIVVRMANSVVTVDSAHLTGRESDLSVTGRVALDQKSPLDLRVNGHLDLAMLQEFSKDLISSGVMQTDATIRGTFSSPQINGRMEFQKAAFNIADVPNGISNAQGVIVFTSDRATIQSLKGETGGGQIELTGFTLYGAGPLVFRLHARAHEVRIRYPEGVSTVVDASLNFTGTEDRSMLAGSITILRSGINLQSDFSSLLAKSAQPVRTPSAQTGLLGGMSFDIEVDTAPDIQFQSSLTENLQAEANLKLRGTASNPALLGRINITQGQLQFFGVTYSINQGSISFYNPVKVEPILDIDLETKARGIDVTLSVTGPATKPHLTPRSDPPLQFNEIVALLATGRAPTSDPSLLTQQSAEPQSWQQIGASTLLGQAIANPVAGRLQRFFGVSKLRIDPTISGVENNPQARLTLEQQVTPSITFTYITNVTSSNPQVVRVEWAFARQWSAVALREENGMFGLDFFYKKRFK